jgi:site-specific DNA-cytosine methylase
VVHSKWAVTAQATEAMQLDSSSCPLPPAQSPLQQSERTEVIALAQANIHFENVLMTEIDLPIRQLADAVCTVLDKKCRSAPLDMMSRPDTYKLDFYLASTPCQSFSSAGANKARSGDKNSRLVNRGAARVSAAQGAKDKRGGLLLEAVRRILRELPKAVSPCRCCLLSIRVTFWQTFMIENVSNLAKQHRSILDDVTQCLRRGGYVAWRAHSRGLALCPFEGVCI